MLAMFVRIREPFVWSKIKSMLGFKLKKKNGFNQLSLNSFVNSAMNVEFVCLILIGVKNYLERI